MKKSTMKTPLAQVERAIRQFSPSQQRKLLVKLPRLLKLTPDDFAALRAAEPAFAFWNNSADSVYDSL